ncbi:MAG TPA: acylphosphatase [Burkholderiaceae bacterium]|jgi:acylphosphatase
MAKHLIITGIVQGVGYRASFMYQARAQHLSGWVRNRFNGSVEAIVSGDAQAVQAIIDWAWRGPSSAQVSDVVVIDVDDALVSDEEFEMRATE